MISSGEDDLERKTAALRQVFWKLRMGHGMSKILPGLYLGNLRDGKDIEQLRKHHISHVLAIHDTAAAIYPKQLKYLCIQINDTPQSNIQKHFPEAITFIHEARMGAKGTYGGKTSNSGSSSSAGGVLVHCVCGISRSTTLVVAYLMTISDHISWQDALRCVKYVRSSANPNLGFQSQLQKYQSDHTLLHQERARLKSLIPEYNPTKDYEYLMKNLKCYEKYCKNLDDKIYPVPAAGQRRYSWAVEKSTGRERDTSGPSQTPQSDVTAANSSQHVASPATSSTDSSSTSSGLRGDFSSARSPEGEINESCSELLHPLQSTQQTPSNAPAAAATTHCANSTGSSSNRSDKPSSNSLRVVDFDRRRSISSERLTVGGLNLSVEYQKEATFQMASSTSNLTGGSRTFGDAGRKHSNPGPAPYNFQRDDYSPYDVPESPLDSTRNRTESWSDSWRSNNEQNRKSQQLHASIPSSSIKPKSSSSSSRNGYENISSDLLSGRRQKKSAGSSTTSSGYPDRRTFFASTSTPNSPLSYTHRDRDREVSPRQPYSHSHRQQTSYREDRDEARSRTRKSNSHHRFGQNESIPSSNTAYRKSSYAIYDDPQVLFNSSSEKNVPQVYYE